ncbi:MAG: HAD-IA family hydrolase [Lachnospiraceae bacterium]|nr:HAD-IA family hydrolase [Lachnospiraceae bacterium]
MKKITTVIFDLDGTLLDTLEDLTDAVNYALEQCGCPGRSIDEVRSFVGNGIRRLIERAVPTDASIELTDRVYAYFKEYYDIHCMDKTRAYRGVPELIRKLHQKGFHMAIVSNKADHAVKELNRHFFAPEIQVAIGSTETGKKKPTPDLVWQALKELGSSKEEAVYIGDSDVDLATAVNAGLPCMAVLWGFRERAFLEQTWDRLQADLQGEYGADLQFAEQAEDIMELLGKLGDATPPRAVFSE